MRAFKSNNTGCRSAPTTTELVRHLESLVERARASLARELHDEVGIRLVSALMDLTWAEQQPASSAEDNQRKLTRARQTLTGAVDLGRQMIESLRPTLLDDVGLFAALRWHLRAACQLADIRCTIELPCQEPAFLSHAPILIFRIVEEALASLLLDKSVTAAELSITANGHVLIVRLSSNGTSATEHGDEDQLFSSSRLQHRVATLGGNLRYQGPVAGGTSITSRFDFKNIIQ
jgi:signal transduction histidine kinase